MAERVASGILDVDPPPSPDAHYGADPFPGDVHETKITV